MNSKRHGLSLGIERMNNVFFLSIKVIGKLTHEDYEQINPLVDSALQGIKSPKVKVYFDALELEGWEPRAMWDDFKFGLKHNNHFEKIAIVGHKKWQQVMTKVGGWFISGKVEYFEEASAAYDWLFCED